MTDVKTTPTLVTFFEDRAEVVRVAECRLGAGRVRVHAFGIGVVADDRSLACKSEGARVVFSRLRRRFVEDLAATGEEIARLEAALATAQTRASRASRAMARAEADAARVSAMLEQWAETVSEVPSRGEDAAKELGAAYDALDRELTQQLDGLVEHRREHEDAVRELERADQRLAQARTAKPRHEAYAEIELDVAREGAVRLELVYRTPCALWRPEHLARLTRTDERSGEIALTSFATVWQCTGETWDGVACRFSTARPSREARPPLLVSDVLHTRRKTDQERKQIVVEAREQAIAVAGSARGTRDVDEMPGVEDGGEVQWLEGKAPSTIPSDGHPVRVEVLARTIPCAVARVSFPERGPATHVRATATLPGPGPLLAGPVTLARETEIVGRGRVSFTAAGEPFELGFGLDDGLRVRRRVVEKRKTTQITGTQHVSREVTLFVSNLADVPRSLSIVERVPVSEVEDVVVDVDRRDGMRLDRGDGFATFDLVLAGSSTHELVLSYRIEAKSNVVLPEL